MLTSLLDLAVATLRQPLELVTSPAERVYWPFLLVAAAIGIGICSWQQRSVVAGVAAVFRRDTLLSRSSMMDVRLILANSVIKVVLFAPVMLSAMTVAVLTHHLLSTAFGAPMSSTVVPRWVIVLIYTLVLFVAWDLSRYLVHRLMHAIPTLWEFHKVHHSADTLTPLTVYRVHPVESLLYSLRGALTTGIVTGAFFYMFQDRAVQFELLGVNAIGLVLNAVFGNLRHSHVWLSFGTSVERWLLSPAQHQLHHSLDPDDIGTNYGSFLALWDRLGGSLKLCGPHRRVHVGLSRDQLNHHPHRATSALIHPLFAVVRRLRRRATPAVENRHEATA